MTKRKLPPGIEALPSGRYRARFIHDGTTYREVLPTITAAKDWRTTTKAELLAGSYVDPRAAEQTFLDFSQEWAAAQDWKETNTNPAIALRRLEQLLPDETLRELDQLALKRVRAQLARRYAPGTVTNTIVYLHAIMRAAYRAGRLPRDPTIGVESKRRRGDDDRRVSAEDVPSRAEVAAIWSAAPARFRAAIALGASGMRIGEVLGVTADRIDLEQRRVRVDRQIQRLPSEGGRLGFTTPKGEKPRTIQISSATALELRRHLRDYGANGVLFRGGRGALMRRQYLYEQAWWPALKGAGLPRDRYVFHALRHHCASVLLAERTPITAVAAHLGDALETIQRVYAHWLPEDDHVLADALERMHAHELAPPRADAGES